MKRNDLSGVQFGRLTAMRRVTPPNTKNPKWLCQCECGNQVEVFAGNLRRSKTPSCGCALSEARSRNGRTHGYSQTQTYRVWNAMRDRCGNPNSQKYADYGGRGISVAAAWRQFPAFLSDMGECPPGMSIERIDNDGNYEPGNCKWATKKEQNRNRRNTRRVEYMGVARSLKDVCEELEINFDRTLWRLNNGWEVSRALEAKK